jgi:hypothetical protein
MKKFIISLLIVAAFVAIPVTVFAQFTANDGTQARARIVTTLTLTNERDLDFGSILKDAAASGAVIIAADSTAEAESTDFTLSDGTSSSAQFLVSGSPNATYNVSFNPTLTLTPALPSNTTEMTINSITSNITTDGVLSASGLQRFYIGGTLNVPADAVADSYSADLTVTVAYN